jgi:hypothetical protein
VRPTVALAAVACSAGLVVAACGTGGDEAARRPAPVRRNVVQEPEPPDRFPWRRFPDVGSQVEVRRVQYARGPDCRATGTRTGPSAGPVDSDVQTYSVPFAHVDGPTALYVLIDDDVGYEIWDAASGDGAAASPFRKRGLPTGRYDLTASANTLAGDRSGGSFEGTWTAQGTRRDLRIEVVCR